MQIVMRKQLRFAEIAKMRERAQPVIDKWTREVGPDLMGEIHAELTKLGASGQLLLPAVYEKQVARLLADPKSEALSNRFARQWLRLGDVDGVLPDAVFLQFVANAMIAGLRRWRLKVEGSFHGARAGVAT